MKKISVIAAALMAAWAVPAGAAVQDGTDSYGVTAEQSAELVAKLKAIEAMAPEAPGFTLKNLEGKDVSLEQFRGKWVVLDFWGSWCVWCIRGIPELKANYEKYAGKVEVIGIDCGDTPAQWREAVRRYELPWVNVYNPVGENSLDRVYGVQGFPTKVIVTPEGKIADITAGEDPAFYLKLDALVNAR